MVICAYRVNWVSVTGTPCSVTGRPMISEKNATVSSKLVVQVQIHSTPFVTRIGRQPPQQPAEKTNGPRLRWPNGLLQCLVRRGRHLGSTTAEIIRAV